MGNIVVPELGESVNSATVVQWLKRQGDRVAAGETLVELETEKVNLEVGAEHGGILARLERQAGEDVRPGDVLGVIEDAAEPPEAAPPENGKQGVGLAPPAGGGLPLPPAEGAREARAAPTAEPAAPAVERVPESEGAPALREDRVRMSRRRRTIARRLVEAQQNAAMLTTFNELDLGQVQELRARQREILRERHGLAPGLTAFFVRAAVGALKAFPRLNAEIQGDEIVLKRYYDIGIAVGAEEGLVVPVLRDADRLSLIEVERRLRDLAGRAEAGTLSLEDLRGGTFTITNGGVFGSLLSTPILNPPQVGIVGLHKVEDRPVVRAGSVLVRPMMYVALSYDHRIVDGREAVLFLVRLKELIEDPERLLLEG